jgi:Lon-like protease
MVDILVRKASLLERLFPGIHDGSTLVPAEQLNPAGVSESQRRRQSLNEMSRSQQVAVAVALRELDYDVEATPNGAEVTLVFPDAPAEGKLAVGDVIVEALGEPVRSPGDLREVMAEITPGREVGLRVRRSGGLRSVKVGTQRSEEEPARAVVGVLVEQSADIDLPVNVRINADQIGGPSAGLAFALDVVDELGEDIDGGRRIVVTGELDLDGNVFAVGGIKQKTIGAREADADLFIVPEENAEEARRYAESLQIVAVSTFDAALSSLTME